MGDPSSLRFVHSAPIDWTRVPEETKKFLIEQYGYDWDNDKVKPLPATIEDLAKMFDEAKFFGYLTSGILTVLMDISEFGLKPTPLVHRQVGPRFYMKYLDQIWFFLFAPGTRDCIMGNSDDIVRNAKDYDDGLWEKMAADETAMAQTYDVRLKQEVLRRMDKLVKVTKKLGGWTATTVQDSLEYTQYVEAIVTLPYSHPAHRGLLKDVLGPLFKK